MKRYLIFLFCTIGMMVMVSSCKKDFLEEEPRTSITPDELFKTKQGMELAANGVYQIFTNAYYGEYGGVKVYGVTPSAQRYVSYLNEVTGDDVWLRNTTTADRVAMDRYEYNGDNENINRIYFSIYRGIKDANLVISRAPQSPVEDDAFKKRIEAEAKAIRAYLYFLYARFYGDGVIITKELTSDEEFSYARQPVAKLYKEIIIPDLEFAINNLPPKYSGNDIGRVTKAAAEAQLAEVYLTMAGRVYSKLTGVFSETQKDFYTKSAALSKSVIDNYGFNLYPNYKDLFTVKGNNSVESIWEVVKDANQFAVEMVPDPASDKNFPGLFPFVDPVSGRTNYMNGYGRYGMSYPLYNMFDTVNDTRVRSLITVNSIYRGNQNLKTFASTKYADSTAITERKIYSPVDAAISSRAHLKLIRLANVLLMYAEAENEVNNSTAAAVEAYNRVRRRAYGSNASVLKPAPTDQAGFREAVYVERRKELYFEGYRWFDLVRTNRLIAEVSKVPSGFNYNYLPSVQEKHYLYPVPTQAFRLNTNLGAQNPGW